VQWLQEESPSTSLIEEPKIVLYVFVEWSDYAHLGGEIVEQAEQRWATRHPHIPVSWWAGDFSSDPWMNWMTEQERCEGIRMFPLAGTGNGSLLWVQHGAVVAFTLSASHLGVGGVLERTEETFGRE
jgi:hypothetical protein